jgi:hypothetical protein
MGEHERLLVRQRRVKGHSCSTTHVKVETMNKIPHTNPPHKTKYKTTKELMPSRPMRDIKMS